MKYLLILLCYIGLYTVHVNSQSISQEVIGSAGSTAQTNSSLEWTIGELAVATYSNNAILTQGFHQGTITISNIINHHKEINIEIFPNPVISTIHINHTNNGRILCIIHNIKGQNIMTQQIEDIEGEIDVSELEEGCYFLSIFDKTTLLKTAKIIKSN